MVDDDKPMWTGPHQIRISTREPVYRASLRLLQEALPGGTGSPGTGFWKDDEDFGEPHLDRDEVTIFSVVDDPKRIEFIKRAVAIVAASLGEVSIWCMTTYPDGTFVPELLYSNDISKEEMPKIGKILTFPWPRNLFSDEFVVALASVNHGRSRRLAEEYRDEIKTLKMEDSEQAITLSKLPSVLSQLTAEYNLKTSEQMVEDCESIIKTIVESRFSLS